MQNACLVLQPTIQFLNGQSASELFVQTRKLDDCQKK